MHLTGAIPLLEARDGDFPHHLFWNELMMPSGAGSLVYAAVCVYYLSIIYIILKSYYTYSKLRNANAVFSSFRQQFTTLVGGPLCPFLGLRIRPSVYYVRTRGRG
jgi:hypothetical protein